VISGCQARLAKLVKHVVPSWIVSLAFTHGLIVLPKITYCLPAWSGLCTAADRTRQLLSETVCETCGYYSSTNSPTISSVADDAEDTVQKHTQKYSTCIAVLPVRATSTALQPQKPTWN